MTSAPWSASNMAVRGPAMYWPKSITRMPASALGMPFLPFELNQASGCRSPADTPEDHATYAKVIAKLCFPSNDRSVHAHADCVHCKLISGKNHPRPYSPHCGSGLASAVLFWQLSKHHAISRRRRSYIVGSALTISRPEIV